MQFFPYLCALILRRCCICLFFLASCLGWQGCSHRALDEARQVVAEADSLWHEGKMYGIDEGDSLSLAQAYETLGKYSAFYSFVHRTSSLGTYAHACYHYGRLLREKNDPVAAMQVFIDATHSCTDDLHILGRIYSNMGTLCHLAGEYPLSYEMYERSGDMYLQNGDTLLYYHNLNNMAFEMAEQGKEEETMALLSEIADNCPYKELKRQTYRTKALLYRTMERYEAMLCALDSLYDSETLSSSDIVLKAQAFWNLGEQDSALYYAREVMQLSSASMQDKYNMLYILMNGDSTLTNEVITDYSAQRSDIEIYVLIPSHNKLAVAMEILKQDLNRKPDLRWLYAILATLLLIGSIGGIYIRRKRKQHKLLSQRIESKQCEISEWQANKINQVEQACAALRASDDLQKDLRWKDYDKMCAIVNGQFYLLANKLKLKGTLNETEIRLCILVLLDFSRAEIAHTLPYALNSIGKLKDHTAKALGTTGKNLRAFLLQMIVEG